MRVLNGGVVGEVTSPGLLCQAGCGWTRCLVRYGELS